MGTTTIRIDERTHSSLRELAATSGEPMSRLLERAVERLRTEAFYAELDRAYERLGDDPDAAAEEAAERAAWEATLSDGLDPIDE